MTSAIPVPTRWYNVLAERGIELPEERAADRTPNTKGGLSAAVPKALVRQNMPLKPWVDIPGPVQEAYREWRPTPLIRLRRLEAALGTSARIYMKYEAGNVAGSHKFLTALAQAYYYAEAGVRTLVTSSAAGQWGTAVAAAAARFDLQCVVHMVPGSYDRKPGRRAAMELLGAEVLRGAQSAPHKQSAPHEQPASHTRPHEQPASHTRDDRSTSLSDVMSEAMERAGRTEGGRWILGGSEPFAILHSTVIGAEARDQLAAAGEDQAPVLIGYLGGGKNVGGLGLPFLAEGHDATIVPVESSSYPVLTRGHYRYDARDRAGHGSQAKMYTLGSAFAGAPIQAEGMRYHAAPKLFSALHAQGMLQPEAYDEKPVFDSARLLLRTEGHLPSAEAAYAVHAACELACRPEQAERPVVFCLSDHGHYDGDAYRAYLDDQLAGRAPDDDEIT
ncbi:TrpB-like pyridoxal phosphate-dependent enzyme [Actinomadura barringtoniae]|uniref:tryptophan synthase n=1 Tax=Actinomadura barringtoniae TaxID=1427535 RepID=A0A939T626_9ACTN|nr:TrpB-like pyridoxal phosphate-dependent enzyme [Actinomadura barringtoniae]MBO2450279.1 TrpB-like pyridoxal phosphate-dependent enzyme [Actinomadura barringtoniae]